MRYPILSSFWKYILYYCLRWYTVNGLGFPCRKMLRNCVTHKWLLVKAKTHRITEVAHWTKVFRLTPIIPERLISNFPSFRIYWSIFYEFSSTNSLKLHFCCNLEHFGTGSVRLRGKNKTKQKLKIPSLPQIYSLTHTSQNKHVMHDWKNMWFFIFIILSSGVVYLLHHWFILFRNTCSIIHICAI